MRTCVCAHVRVHRHIGAPSTRQTKHLLFPDMPKDSDSDSQMSFRENGGQLRKALSMRGGLGISAESRLRSDTEKMIEPSEETKYPIHLILLTAQEGRFLQMTRGACFTWEGQGCRIHAQEHRLQTNLSLDFALPTRLLCSLGYTM